MATPTTPVVTVEIAFASNAMETVPTWTDVSAYVRSGTISVGRSNELDEYQAGRATLVLDNRDRRFDPLHASGPYYGNLKARKQIRIKTTWNSTTRTMFSGFVASWGVSPEVEGDSVWQLEAYDGLAYLATVDLPPDVYWYVASEFDAPAVSAWWPLGDTTVIAQDRKSTYNYTYTTASPKTSQNPPYISGAAQQFDGTYGLIGPAINGYLYQWSASFMVKTDTAGPTGGLNPILMGVSAVDPVSIGIDQYGRLAYRWGASNTAHSGFAITDNIWHHVVVTGVAGGGAAIYVDGYLLSAGNTTGDSYDGDGFQLIAMSNVTGTDSLFFTGELSNVAIWNSNLAASDVTSLAKAALYGAPATGTTSDKWVALILDAAGWPSAWRSLETGTVEPGGMVWADKDALSMLQLVTRTERGRAYVARDGLFTFHASSHDYTASDSITSQCTFSDSGLAAVVPFSSIGRIVYSDEYLANRVTVTTADNVGYTVDSTSSQTTYGIRARQIDTIVKNGSDAINQASVILSQYESPELRIDDWMVLPQTKPDTSYPAVLALDLADRVTLEIKPSNVGTRLSQEVLIEAIAHSFTPERWETTLSASPAVQVWLLEDATYGLLEQTTILG